MVIEDCCHATGTKWDAGSGGDIKLFSFQNFKLITSGEGGMLITDNEEYKELCHSYIDNGRIRKGDKYAKIILGRDYRLTEIQAAILLAQFDRLEEQTQKRIENANYLSEKLSQIDGIQPLQQSQNQAYYAYIFKYNAKKFNEIPLNLFLKALIAEGIECRKLYPPDYEEKVLLAVDPKSYPRFCSYYGDNPDSIKQSIKSRTPVTERIYNEEGVWIDSRGPLLGTHKDMDDIFNAIKKIKDNIEELLQTR